VLSYHAFFGLQTQVHCPQEARALSLVLPLACVKI
jgi:hypothetical protein